MDEQKLRNTALHIDRLRKLKALKQQLRFVTSFLDEQNQALAHSVTINSKDSQTSSKLKTI